MGEDDDNQIGAWRVRVIESFIAIEWLMNCIITQHYFRAQKQGFIFEVLYDRYMNFGLRLNIFKKVLKKIKGTKDNGKLRKEDNKMIENLQKMDRIRNIYAHIDAVIIDSKGQGRIPDPDNWKKSLDMKKKYEDYVKKEKEVLIYLRETGKAIGFKFMTEKELK